MRGDGVCVGGTVREGGRGGLGECTCVRGVEWPQGKEGV